MTSPTSKAYRSEAQKLYALAASFPFSKIRDEFVEIAHQYEALARHAEVVETRTTTELPETAPSASILRFAPE